MDNEDTETPIEYVDDPNDSSDEPEDTDPASQVVYVTVRVDTVRGYTLDIHELMNPITLAGIGWWLQYLAEEGLMQQAAMMAAAAATAQRDKKRIHVPGFKDNPLS